MRLALALLAAAAALAAQELKVYSEFQRIDPFGKVVAPDATGTPREILSPVVARNSWASFHIACTVAPGVPSFLYIQQNPELFEVTLYQEVFVKSPRGWIPDGLEKVALPHTIILPDAVHPVPNQGTAVFWLDIRVPARTPPGRMRFQAVLKSGDRWLIYPMEVRVAEKSVTGQHGSRGPLPEVRARSDAALLGAIRKRACGIPEHGSGGAALTVRRLIHRNAVQDLSLAPKALAPLLPAGICKTAPEQAEWWLPVRRAIYQKR